MKNCEKLMSPQQPCVERHVVVKTPGPNVVVMLGQRRRRWFNITGTVDRCLVFAGKCCMIISCLLIIKYATLPKYSSKQYLSNESPLNPK